MRYEAKSPTLAHDVRALAGLYRTLLVMWARRLTRRERWDEEFLYGPVEMRRPRVISRRDD
jgi:hypothetical protein